MKANMSKSTSAFPLKDEVDFMLIILLSKAQCAPLEIERINLCSLYDQKADSLWILLFMPTEQIKY